MAAVVVTQTRAMELVRESDLSQSDKSVYVYLP